MFSISICMSFLSIICYHSPMMNEVGDYIYKTKKMKYTKATEKEIDGIYNIRC